MKRPLPTYFNLDLQIGVYAGTSPSGLILKSFNEAITNWNVNCIRLPVKEHFWFGKDKWQKDGGAAYRQLVDDSVNLCAANGLYIVIDLHRFRAP